MLASGMRCLCILRMVHELELTTTFDSEMHTKHVQKKQQQIVKTTRLNEFTGNCICGAAGSRIFGRLVVYAVVTGMNCFGWKLSGI